MKKGKLFIILASFVMILTLFVACNGDDSNVENPEPSAETYSEGNNSDLEQVTLTFHYHSGPNGVFIDDWPVWQQIALHTGVSLTNTANPVADDAVEQFNLEAVNGFPADIYGGLNIGPNITEFGMQGAFIPLNDLIDSYAPHIRALLDERPIIENFITASDGNIYFIPFVPDGTVARTMFIRQDWLDILELDQPQTVEELEAVLIAFRDYMPAHTGNDVVHPLFDDNWFTLIRYTNLWGARAFGNDNPANRIVPHEDSDELYHAWLADEFMVGIQNLSRWYEEGLIDPQIFTRGTTSRQELLSQNMGGMTMHFPLSTADFNQNLRDSIDGFNFVAMAPPVGTDGRRVAENERIPVQASGWAISHNNAHPEATMRMFDFLFAPQGRHLMSFGAEGVTFDLVNGEPIFRDMVHEQPQPVPNFLRDYMGSLRFLGYHQMFEYEMQLATPEASDAVELYGTGEFFVRQLPPLSFTSAEEEVIGSIQANLNAYLDENIQSMILNDWTEIEDRWNDFVQGAINIGADELLAAHQSAFDRFIENFGE